MILFDFMPLGGLVGLSNQPLILLDEFVSFATITRFAKQTHSIFIALLLLPLFRRFFLLFFFIGGAATPMETTS